MAVLGDVPVILWTARYKFFDGIVMVQFTGKLAKVIAQDRVGLPLLLHVNDQVGVIVQDAFPQQFQSLIEAETAQHVVKQATKMFRLGDTGMSSS